MSLPPPPPGGAPLVETIPAGTRLWRIHPHRHPAPPSGWILDDGTLFNPGKGSATRFAPLHTGTGHVVPTMYAGASRRAALFETVLHDRMPGSVIDARKLTDLSLTQLELVEPIHVALLHGRGLRLLGLQSRDITHTFPSAYPFATAWASWLHDHATIAGLRWTSNQDDDERAYVLFGDRIIPGQLAVVATSTPLGTGEGCDWVESVAASVGILMI